MNELFFKQNKNYDQHIAGRLFADCFVDSNWLDSTGNESFGVEKTEQNDLSEIIFLIRYSNPDWCFSMTWLLDKQTLLTSLIAGCLTNH